MKITKKTTVDLAEAERKGKKKNVNVVTLISD